MVGKISEWIIFVEGKSNKIGGMIVISFCCSWDFRYRGKVLLVCEVEG